MPVELEKFWSSNVYRIALKKVKAVAQDFKGSKEKKKSSCCLWSKLLNNVRLGLEIYWKYREIKLIKFLHVFFFFYFVWEFDYASEVTANWKKGPFLGAPCRNLTYMLTHSLRKTRKRVFPDNFSFRRFMACFF